MAMYKRRDEAVLTVHGIPDDVPARVAAVARSRLYQAYGDVRSHSSGPDPVIAIGAADALLDHVPGRPDPAGEGTARTRPAAPEDDEAGEQDRTRRYTAQQPLFAFEQLVLPVAVKDQLITAVEAIRLRTRLYDDWGLRAIEPNPSVALNLHGPPGTGKTLAAHAIASRLGVPIIMAGYAELESKFHGDGPKNVKAAFQAASEQNALLFVDEADSLLSRRLTDVTQGSEQAINSMRSQIVLCLDQFDGVVIFSTNLVANYDKAFESRVRHFHFPLPDDAARHAIWKKLLVPALPVAADVDHAELVAATDGLSGRSIKLAIIAAAEHVALAGRDELGSADFLRAVRHLRAAQQDLQATTARPPTPEERAAIEGQLAALDADESPTPAPADLRAL
jgi:SpoVK/Ycf46/Vps4 family AAA+-type ATPase